MWRSNPVKNYCDLFADSVGEFAGDDLLTAA
jgi:hypothetical protein